MTRSRKKEFKSVANEQANSSRKKVNERSRGSAHDACTWCDRLWHSPHSSARGTFCFCCSLVRNQLGKQTKRKNALNQQRIGFRLRLVRIACGFEMQSSWAKHWGAQNPSERRDLNGSAQSEMEKGPHLCLGVGVYLLDEYTMRCPHASGCPFSATERQIDRQLWFRNKPDECLSRASVGPFEWYSLSLWPFRMLHFNDATSHIPLYLTTIEDKKHRLSRLGYLSLIVEMQPCIIF